MKLVLGLFVVVLAGCGGSQVGSAPVSATQSAPSISSVSQPPVQSSPAGLVTAPVEKYVPVAFMGDSITFNFRSAMPAVDWNAGIPSNMTAMMLARFQTDVLDYHPAVVVILGGINDIKQQVGIDSALQNVAQMAQNAAATGACVILGTLLPVADYAWTMTTQLTPAQGDAQVAEYNRGLRALAASYGYHVVDYYAAFTLPDGTQNAPLFLSEGLHPNDDGSAVMWKTVQPQLAACGLVQ